EANLLDAKYNLALAYKEIGQIDSAKKQMEELSQLLPDDERVRSVLEELGTKPDSVEKE
ncbi:tetratricopeptide repeat protein, partial [Candidatus Poribacteria bacterium]|nr:tetratricopeptide repeat protein [Candidatus Poribacteria bacterium]